MLLVAVVSLAVVAALFSLTGCGGGSAPPVVKHQLRKIDHCLRGLPNADVHAAIRRCAKQARP